MLKETIFLYFLSKDLYRKPKIENVDFSDVDLSKVIKLSMQNNMLYFHSVKLLELFSGSLKPSDKNALEKIVFQAQKEIKRIEDSLVFINDNLDNFLLVKTYRGYPRLPNDLDVLVEDFNSARDKLTKKGFRIVDYFKDLQESTLVHGDFYKIHLHAKVSWAGGESFLDKNLVFKNPKEINYGSAKIKIPNYDADFLMHIAHINFEPLHIIISELFYLYKISKYVNWDIQFEQTKKYKWSRTFKRTLDMMDQIHHTLYNNACPFNSLDLKHTFCKDNKCIILPAALSRRHLILTCLEKGLFLYPLKKFVKSARLLFSGNTYRDYIPTEYKFFKEDIEKITNNRECCCERCT